ncbi:MAG: box helicase [Verrucomicrobiaceae bacterium]|nr:box helicase [Verrucomicrobiaceae bacterium]
MSQKLFSELGLSPEILQAVEHMGFEQASPIQSAAIPALLSGRDMIGQSQTGSGKTAAFGIPAIERVDANDASIQVLIMCPTRELASQVAEEIAKLAAFKKGVRELPIYGGASYDRQFRGLRSGPQIVIGTPGRLLDHINSGAIKLDKLKMVILDEADRMLDMGFRDDLEKILEAVPETRQTVLFSATIPPGIRKMIERFTNDPAQIRIEATALTIPNIEQSYVEVDFRSKTEVLCRLLDVHDVKYGIIFGFTKIQVDEVTEALIARGYIADKLHGDMTQPLRERVMKRFRDRQVELLVATDVAARGLDVDDLEIVFNYELPYDPEDYVHRIGRTGRAGKSGKAISLVAGREFGRLQQVNRFTKTQMTRITVPKMEDLENKHATRLVDNVRSTLEAHDYKVQDAIVDDLLQSGHTPAEVISALLHLLAAEVVRPVERIKEDMMQRDAGPRQQRSFDGPPGAQGPGGEQRFERRERPVRGDRPGSTIDATGTWLRINIGKNAGVLPKDVVGCLAGESGLDSSVIGQIQILPTITLVQVAAENSEHILTSINGARMCGRAIGASVGSPPKPMGDRPPGVGFGGPPRREGGGYGGPRREGGGYGGGGPRYGKPGGGGGGGYRGNRD